MRGEIDEDANVGSGRAVLACDHRVEIHLADLGEVADELRDRADYRGQRLAVDRVGAAPADYYPAHQRAEIDAINDRIYRDVNNGVYRAGFAITQEAYDEAVASLFKTLDWLEAKLSRSRYLLGDQLSEADIRLFTTLVRFDAVYHGHFKCNIRRIVDYPALWRFTRDIYNLKGVAETVNLHHIRHHYYESHTNINPSGIVPAGPVLDLSISADELSKMAYSGDYGSERLMPRF